MALHNAPKVRKPARNTERARAAAEATADRSAAIRKTWSNKKVAAARSTKDRVKVNGTEYRSVLDAFTQLKLPTGAHSKFRAELKADGRKVFVSEKGDRHTFTIVKAAA